MGILAGVLTVVFLPHHVFSPTPSLLEVWLKTARFRRSTRTTPLHCNRYTSTMPHSNHHVPPSSAPALCPPLAPRGIRLLQPVPVVEMVPPRPSQPPSYPQ